MMTQEKWDAMSQSQREAARDESNLHPMLKPYIGKRVRVEPKREFRMSTFRVGVTTGWKPVLLAMRGNARGSSDIISVDETFTKVTVLG
jgi:hypothetical protein